jgi:hypothetical protein
MEAVRVWQVAPPPVGAPPIQSDAVDCRRLPTRSQTESKSKWDCLLQCLTEIKEAASRNNYYLLIIGDANAAPSHGRWNRHPSSRRGGLDIYLPANREASVGHSQPQQQQHSLRQGTAL